MLKQLRNITNFIGTLSYSVLFVTFIFQVVMRFAFNKPLSWSDELIVILYVFSMFWAGAFMLKEKDHVMLDIVYEQKALSAAPNRKPCTRSGFTSCARIFN